MTSERFILTCSTLWICFLQAEAIETKSLMEHPAWKLLHYQDTECGESYSDRIIGGVDASLGQYPWMARIGYGSTGVIEYKCGGSLINNMYVLTAAHCVQPTTPVTIRLGEYDTTKEIDCSNEMCADPVQDIGIDSIVVHDSYDKPKFTHDVALIKLKNKANFNGWVGHICLPKPGYKLDINSAAETAGWGVTSMDTLETATILQTLKVPLVHLDKCNVFYRKVTRLTQEQLCAGGKVEHDACGGDSGGPLMQVKMGQDIPQYFLIGVVSFGPTMCGGTAPGVFANTSYYLKWILDNIAQTNQPQTTLSKNLFFNPIPRIRESFGYIMSV